MPLVPNLEGVTAALASVTTKRTQTKQSSKLHGRYKRDKPETSTAERRMGPSRQSAHDRQSQRPVEEVVQRIGLKRRTATTRQSRHDRQSNRPVEEVVQRIAINIAARTAEADSTCASGSSYYRCNVSGNTFEGCCSTDPCNPGGGCPDGTTTLTATTQTSTASVTTTTIKSTEISATAISTATGTVSTGMTTVTGSSSSTTSATTSATAASSNNTEPVCPAGNNTIYTDASKIAYTIHCDQDNQYGAFSTVQVSTGGYGECFTACSDQSVCAGFAYDGLDSGSCYLKHEMPAANYTATAGSNYISCSKNNATASASSPSSLTSVIDGKRVSTGVVVGGVVGGIAGLIILSLLILLCVRYREKKREEQAEDSKQPIIIHNATRCPVETTQLGQGNVGHGTGHGRTTSRDVFAPPSAGSHQGMKTAHNPEETRPSKAKASTHAGIRAEGSCRRVSPHRYAAPEANHTPEQSQPAEAEGLLPMKDVLLTTDVYTKPSRSRDRVATPDFQSISGDSNPISRPPSAPRSPRFTEHIAGEHETTRSPRPQKKPLLHLSTSVDSPTLGQDSSSSVYTMESRYRG